MAAAATTGEKNLLLVILHSLARVDEGPRLT